jgi:NADPH:quinone reductase-like Zn-dependent oxidoreductase
MKAVVLTHRGKDGVQVMELDPPVRKAGHVLLKMQAAALNRVDLYMRDNGAGITHSLPQIMGIEGVGLVVETDDNSRFQKDDFCILYPSVFCQECEFCLSGNQPLCTNIKIFGEHMDGTFAQYVSVPEASLVKMKAGCDPIGASTLGVAYLTGWRMLFGKKSLQPGQSVLIVGAGGGVASACVELAKLAGLIVVVTTSGAAKTQKLKELGANLVIDYRDEGVQKSVLAFTEGRGVDLVVDCVGEATWASSLKSLCRGGDIVTCGATTGSHPSADIQRLFVRQIGVHGSTMGSMKEFFNLISSFNFGQLTPQIDSVFPIHDINEALLRLEAPDRFGKVVITF